MTREEAIKWLDGIEKKYIHGGDESFDNSRKQAIHMAISSLEAWDNVIDKLRQFQEPEDPTLVVTMRIDHLINLIKRYLREVEDERIC